MTAQRFTPQQVAEARERYTLSSILSKYVVLKRQGAEFIGLCPFHNEKTPSFTVNDRKGFFHCFGCGAHGDAIAAVMQLERLEFADAVGSLLGTDAPNRERRPREAPRDDIAQDRDAERQREEQQRTNLAREIWHAHQPLDPACLGAIYLFWYRGIRSPWPTVLGYVPNLWFSPAQCPLPALVARMDDGRGNLTAVQRIYLDPASGHKTMLSPKNKRTIGPMRDGAVKLAPADTTLGIAGSVEDALAAHKLFSLSCWATCGENRLGAVTLPPTVETVVIFADADDAGLRQAKNAAAIYRRQHRHVEIHAPITGEKDWDEVLQNGR